MSATSLQIITLDLPNPEWQGQNSDTQPFRVNDTFAFNYITSFDITTLSTTGANNGNDVTGLLYTPDLAEDSPCVNITAPHVPQNATRRANLPPTDYDLIAIAPWVTPDCSLEYMTAARNGPIQGFLFFLPGSSTGTPPNAKDNQWNIPSGGNWKAANGYPVYVLNGQDGTLLLSMSALYSKNMTDVPFGHNLTERYDSRDYVRLFADVNTGSGATLPSLWVFLLVVLGILLAIIGLTSLSMHYLQRRRRISLQRRVASGEVDLEALGIKRLTVPQELLDEMPLYTYGSRVPVTQASHTAASSKDGSVEMEKSEGALSTTTKTARAAPAVMSGSYQPTALSQPTCAICLDDYVAGTADEEGTIVRELPCQHIFHPECVDTFLRESSSLCPMCKKTALPKGYCPRVITNAMVRRERLIRGVRERMVEEADVADESNPRTFAQRMQTISGFNQLRHASRRFGTTPVPNSQQMTHLDRNGATVSTASGQGPPLVRSNSGSSRVTTSARPPANPPATADHAEMARQRAEEMLGSMAPADPEAEEARRIPAWRKALRGLFPGR